MTVAELTACCGSSAWAQEMYLRQPFTSQKAMHDAADEVWWSLSPDDWREAFLQHPQIGQKAGSKWSDEEQSGMRHADASLATEMARLNAAYHAKFGFIFIVCASGKTASEMLQLIKTRVENGTEEEMRTAAAEQAQITHLRLEKLVAR